MGGSAVATSIRITAGDVSIEAELNDSATAEAIAEELPIKGSANRWGDEIYFSIPIDEDEADDARTEMAVGELAYWPPGNAFCIFWGRTPASEGDEPRAASNVNPIGMIAGDASVLAQVDSGAPIRIEAS
jgi:hypothetical protein